MNEREWLATFLDVRADDLCNPRDGDPRTRKAWASSVSRVTALRSVLDAHNDDLRPPLTINPYGTKHTLDAAA